MGDQDRISSYNINTISSRQVMRIEKNINWGIISWSDTNFSFMTYITRTVWQTVRRITCEILGVKGFIYYSVIYDMKPAIAKAGWPSVKTQRLVHCSCNSLGEILHLTTHWIRAPLPRVHLLKCALWTTNYSAPFHPNQAVFTEKIWCTVCLHLPKKALHRDLLLF